MITCRYAFITILSIFAISFAYADSLVVPRIGRGVNDDSAVIQKYLDRCASTHGGIVFLKAGKYRLDKPITIPSGVTLKGDWAGGPHHTMIDRGTVLLAYAGKGTENESPLIKLNSSSVIKGVTIYYPEQKLPDPHPYPWTIQGEGTDCGIIDVTLTNSYKGVDFETYPNERHYIRNLFGGILRNGISVDQSKNGRIENVHFSQNYWVRASLGHPDEFWGPLFADSYLNLTAFKFGKADNEYVTNTFAIPCKIGYHFAKSKHGACSGIFNGIGIDFTQMPILVEETQDSGILITNAQVVAGNATHNEAHINVTPDHTGTVQFANCSFWGPAKSIARIFGTGTVSMFNCNMSLYTWDIPSGEPAIEINGGSFSLVSSTLFAGWDRIIIGKDVKSAVIMSNNARGNLDIENESSGDVQIIGNSIKRK